MNDFNDAVIVVNDNHRTVPSARTFGSTIELITTCLNVSRVELDLRIQASDQHSFDSTARATP